MDINRADVSHFADVWIAASGDSDFKRMLYPARLRDDKRSDADRAKALADTLWNDVKRTEASFCQMIRAEGGQIAGFSIWWRPGHSPQASIRQDSCPDLALDVQLYADYNDAIYGDIATALSTDKFWYLQRFYIHPDYQRRGLGSELFKRNIETICKSLTNVDAKCPLVMAASDAGRALYEKYNFRWLCDNTFTYDVDGVPHVSVSPILCHGRPM